MTIKSALKAIVPLAVREQIVRPARRRLHWSLALHQWRRMRETRQKRAGGAIRKIILIPTDFHGIIGSLGDDAMITATLHHLDQAFDRPEILVLTGTDGGDAVVRSLNLTPVGGWNDLDFVRSATSILAQHAPNAVVVVGADVIDGHYDGIDAAKALIFADLASRGGAHVTVLGFSFNAQPAPEVITVLNGIDVDVALNVRDPVSLERFERASSAQGHLVADVAFLLPPSQGKGDIALAADWIDRERAAGRTVLGLNIHPMLFKQGHDDAVKCLLARVTDMATTYLSRNVSWLLVPHDYRAGVGDIETLDTLMQRLATVANGHVRVLDGRHRAADLKGLAARLDGAVTGRMHFAIAALGSGVPVLTITYQDKFEGLFALAGLPSWLGVPAEQALQDGVLLDAVEQFVGELECVRSLVIEAKPNIQRMSAKNFAAMTIKES